MFQLNKAEVNTLVSQNVIPYVKYFGGSLAYAFTEQGLDMLSVALNSDRAILVNIEIMRAFFRLRKMPATNAVLARKIKALEKKYDEQFAVVFEAIYWVVSRLRSSEKKTEMRRRDTTQFTVLHNLT